MEKYTIQWRGKEGTQPTEFHREADELDIIECLIHFFTCENGRYIGNSNLWDSFTIIKHEKETANFTDEQIDEWLKSKHAIQ